MRLKLSDEFGKCWKKEYLIQLRKFNEVRNLQKCCNIREGGVVLIQEDVRPRHMWRKSVDDGLLEGRDHRLRIFMLTTSEGGKFSRPVQLDVSLEVHQGGEDVED